MDKKRRRNSILLVDDDLDDGQMFVEALREIEPGISCIHLETGAALFEHLSAMGSEKPDLIFLDINMPEMSGWQCLPRLKQEPSTRQIPIIMYTTSSRKQDKVLAMELGASAFITKPSHYLELKRILLKAVENIGADIQNALSSDT